MFRKILCLLDGHDWIFQCYEKWNEESLPCGSLFKCKHCTDKRVRYFQSEIRRRKDSEEVHRRIGNRIHQQYIKGLATK